MKKILFVNLDYPSYHTKTNAEIKAFENAGIKASLIYSEANKCYFKESLSQNPIYLNINIGKQRDKSGYTLLAKAIERVIVKNSFDYMYVRRMGIAIIYFKKLFRAISPTTKIFYEIPTYPFDKTTSLKINILQQFEEYYLKNIIYRYIDKFPVILQSNTKIWNKMVPFSNGVDIDNYSIRKHVESDMFRMLIIAHVNYWHGYDRLLAGLKEYHGKQKVEITFWGDSTDETRKLKVFCKKYRLTNVKFKEFDEVKDMNDFCNNFDVGVGSLGYYRRNASVDTSIKNKEYCALGLPFIHSCFDNAFPDTFKYHHLISNDNTAVDIGEIIMWYNSIKSNEMYQEMYCYAKGRLSYSKLVEKVIR